MCVSVCVSALRTIKVLQLHHGHPKHGLHWTLYCGNAVEAASAEAKGEQNALLLFTF